MTRKIAVITTEFLHDFTSRILTDLHLDFEFRIFIYHSYRDVAQVFGTIPDEFEGVITSGVFPATIVRKCYPDTKKVITYFNSDDAGIYRLFFHLLLEKNADLSRIYGDFVGTFGIGLEDYLLRDQLVTYTELIDPRVDEMDLEDIYEVEQKQFEKHRSLHQSGRIDLSVTRFSSILPKMQKEGLTVYFPYPSMGYVRNVVLKLFQDLDMRALRENMPAVINVAVDMSDGEKDRRISLQKRSVFLQEALLSFGGGSLLDYVLQQTGTGFEILTSKKLLETYTDGFSRCRLTDYLASRLDFGTDIGYGVGVDIYQARIHAMDAGREAGMYKRGSYLIDESGCLVGPLNQPEGPLTVVTTSATVRAISERSGLSPLTVSKILGVIQSMPERQLTARDLAFKLYITKRSANRFLSALLSVGAVQVAGEQRATTKGRPERVYRMS